MSYTLFIDESGDNGIRRVRTSNGGGSTPWFCLGGYLIRDDSYDLIADKIQFCENEMGKKIHFTNLNQKQRLFVCQELSKTIGLCFGTISYKPTLIKKGYGDRIRGEYEKSDYYNKNVHYLLEKVAKYFSIENLDSQDLKIIFEHKDDVNYRRMKNYIKTIQKNPLEGDAKYLEKINADLIKPIRRNNEPLLKLADIVASSIFQACENKVLGIRDTSYLAKISNRFYSGNSGEVLNFGIKPIHSIHHVGLNEEEKDFFINLNNLSEKRALTG